MIRKLDDWLIDEVFQRVADRLAAIACCYSIAAFLFTGFILGAGFDYTLQQDYVGLALLSLWAPRRCWQAYRRVGEPLSNVMPIDRVAYFYLRVLMGALSTIFMVMALSMLGRMREVPWLIMVAAEYFMACRRRPPIERRSHVPSMLAQNT